MRASIQHILAALLIVGASIMPTPELFDSGVPRSQSDAIARLYRAAAEKLKAIVLDPQGRTQGSQEFKQARAAALIAQIDRLLAELNQQSAGWIGDNVPQAMLDGLKRAEKQAQDLGIVIPPGGGSFDLIDKGTVALFGREIYADLAGASGSLGDAAKKALRQTAQQDLDESQVDTILAGGVIEGKPRQAIKELKDALTAVNDGVVTITDKNGDPMQFDAGYYASMVVRTKTRQATVSARHDRLQSLGLDLVSVVGLVSKNFCTGYLGMVFSLGGKSDKYPSIDELPGGGPPFHPNCSKSTRPFVEELASNSQLDQAEGVDDSDKLLNVDPSEAQRRFKDLQIGQQVKESYATTADKLFS